MAESVQHAKRRTKRFAPEQYNILEREFAADQLPTPAKCLRIAKELGVTTEEDIRRVKIWFINRRTKDRKLSTKANQGNKDTVSKPASLNNHVRQHSHPMSASAEGSSTDTTKTARSSPEKLPKRVVSLVSTYPVEPRLSQEPTNVSENGGETTKEAGAPMKSSVAQEDEMTDEYRLVQIVSRDGQYRTFRGKITKPLSLLKKPYAAMEQVCESQLLFVCKGRVVRDDDTPATLGRRSPNEVVNQIDVYFLEQSTRNANLPVTATPYQPQTEPISPVESCAAEDLFQSANQENGPVTSTVQDSANSSVTDLGKQGNLNSSVSLLTGRPLTNKARKSFVFVPKKSV